MEFQSPGGAFANSIDDSLMRRAAMQRQTMLDNLTIKKEADLANYRQQELEAGKAALEEKRAEHAQMMDDRKKKSVLDTVGGMVEGDVPSEQLLHDAQMMGVPIRMRNSPPPTLAGTAGMSGVAPAGPITPQEPPSGIAAPLPQVYAGSKQEMEAKATRQRQQEYADSLPDGPLKADAQFGLQMGRNPVASTVAPPKVAVDPTATHAANRDYDIAHPLPEKPAHEPNPAPQALTGPDGKTHFVQFVGGKMREVPNEEGFTKPTTQEKSTTANKKTGLEAVNRLSDDVADADRAGLLGPAAGRYYSLLAKTGTTGNKAKDRIIGNLKSHIVLMKMHIDAGIGGSRSAASPLLMKNWDEIAMSSSKDLLDGYLGGIKEDLGGKDEAAKAKPLTAAELIEKYK